ncbi:DUF2975 domain-containing protein [Caulobacter segnis]|uniref:DUF2975 domain-containing protein n=1 Tax=Caulobacter segnis TaxID=88688 RepID=UPI0024107E0E|nr:DUF2975 domain-containing protein [Caulobacter segnis]MDG2523644.1 DUF2975 domain-containing protein [Caulobacter segnis]
MTTVVQLKPAPVALPTAAHHQRLRLASRALSWLFTALLILVGAIAAALIAAVVFYTGDDFRIGSNAVWIGKGSADSVAFRTLSLPHRLAYAAVGVVRIAPSLMIFWRLRELFALYSQGEVFGRRNGWLIGQVGVWLCAYAVAPLLCHLFLSATGWEIDRKWMHLASIQAFILGLLVFVIAQVMQVGREIEEDREAFV